MYVTAAVLSVLLALVTLAAGAPKALLKGDVSAGLQSHMGLSAGLVRFIGLAEVAAAVGLIVGLFWQPLGIAAAIGFAITMVGAVGFHAKTGDYADPATRGNAMAPLVLIAVSVATAVTLGLAM
ncbi:DoxX family protein [Streptomyces himalayensis]|uniref:DoxX family protein n=1 Tax=Streptomyces himalayensis subsp. himalayensis TaxID=2756131 RepID=A0A7W0I8B6_9ACTN|nr:DoxX family protein [Streptomyces himalayensis]MBA2945814.1 DoxX family protein [Streptomyces himalayensis subsp. himalayensis]